MIREKVEDHTDIKPLSMKSFKDISPVSIQSLKEAWDYVYDRFRSINTEGLTNKEKEIIKNESGWSDEIIDNIDNMEQYDILKNADLTEVKINDRPCLIKNNIDLNYTDQDGISNKERMKLGLAPLDSKTGKPIELHHLGQKVDSPLVELTIEEHRTGENQEGKKNQSIWHDNTVKSEARAPTSEN